MSGRLCYAGAILLLLAAMPVPAIASDTGDSTAWHREGKYFSFEIPPGLRPSGLMAIDSYVAEWAGERLRIRASEQNSSWPQWLPGAAYLEIDGRPARLWIGKSGPPYWVSLEVRDLGPSRLWHLDASAKDVEARDQAVRTMRSVRFPGRIEFSEGPRPRPPRRHRRRVDCGFFTFKLPADMIGTSPPSIESDRRESPRLMLQWTCGTRDDCGVDPKGHGRFLLDGHPAQISTVRDPGYWYRAELCVEGLPCGPDSGDAGCSARLHMVVCARWARDRGAAMQILRSVHIPRTPTVASTSR